MNSTVQMSDNNFKKSGPDKKENKVKGLYTIYNMNSTAQMTDNNFKKSGPDKKENKVKGLSTIYCILYIYNIEYGSSRCPGHDG